MNILMISVPKARYIHCLVRKAIDYNFSTIGIIIVICMMLGIGAVYADKHKRKRLSNTLVDTIMYLLTVALITCCIGAFNCFDSSNSLGVYEYTKAVHIRHKYPHAAYNKHAKKYYKLIQFSKKDGRHHFGKPRFWQYL